MDTRTGELLPMADVFKLPKEEQEHFVELTDEEAEMLKGKSLSERAKFAQGMNRAERRAAARGRRVGPGEARITRGVFSGSYRK